jgi:hypothetical protein
MNHYDTDDGAGSLHKGVREDCTHPDCGFAVQEQASYDLHAALLVRCGFKYGAEESAGGSADNDLAHERAETVLEFLEFAAKSPLPRKLLPSLGSGTDQ